MNHDFWHARWSAGQIGFHEGAPNAQLVEHLPALGPSRRVLVPLCGKSADLGYLAEQGHEVVGVELVAAAVEAYFSERGLSPTRSEHGEHVRYTAGRVTIVRGDFLTTTRELLGPVDALFDRAAVIALPAALRGRYLRHLRALLAPGSPGLFVTLEYADGALEGPPFSVPERELREHDPRLELTCLATLPASGNPRLVAAGAVERCFVARFAAEPT